MVETYNTPSSSEERDLPHDARQVLVKLIDRHMNDIADSKKLEEFYNWLRNIQDLYDTISHKLTEEDIEMYNNNLRQIYLLIQKYPTVFNGSNKDPRSRDIIQQALRTLERFVYKKMDEANIFGVKYDDDGL